MRPPLNAGENDRRVLGRQKLHAASMRPPLNAGENPLRRAAPGAAAAASMRPPLNAGENAQLAGELALRERMLQ